MSSNSLFLIQDVHLLLPSVIRAPDSRAFRLELNDTTGFPGSPAHKQRVRELLSLPNCTGQFP